MYVCVAVYAVLSGFKIRVSQGFGHEAQKLESRPSSDLPTYCREAWGIVSFCQTMQAKGGILSGTSRQAMALKHSLTGPCRPQLATENAKFSPSCRTCQSRGSKQGIHMVISCLVPPVDLSLVLLAGIDRHFFKANE